MSLLVACGTPQTAVEITEPGVVTPDAPEQTADPGVFEDGTLAPSGKLAASTLGDRIYLPDADNGEVLTYFPGSKRFERLVVGEEPTQLQLVGDDLLVTMRATGHLAHLVEGEDGLELVRTAHVGAEPFDVVVSPDRQRVYVSLSQEGAIVELDPATLAEVDRWTVGGEPRDLLVVPGPAGDRILATMVDHAAVAVVDHDTAEITEWAVPQMDRFVNPACEARKLDARISGGMALHPDGDQVLVPVLFADTTLVEPPGNDDCAETDVVVVLTQDEAPAYYAPPVPPLKASKVGRFNAAVVSFDIGSGGVRFRDAVSTREQVSSNTQVAVRGYPGDIHVAEGRDGQRLAMVPIPGAGRIVLMDLDGRNTPEDSGRFTTRERSLMVSSTGAESVLVDPGTGQIFAWSPVSRKLNWRKFPVADSYRDDATAQELFTVRPPDSVLPQTVQRGRELFFDTMDPSMVQPNSGTSCATCHAEGRTDGFTWQFEDFPRQTPSLAGDISRTAPFTWTGHVVSVRDEINNTTRSRMGGTGLRAGRADELAAFVEATRAVQLPGVVDAALVAEGEALFHDSRVGCDTCHTGEDGTDGEMWQVFDFDVPTNTPQLRGIAATGPYLHDGSAATLRDVLLAARDGSMGNTGGLTDHELDALEAYLRTR
jgi:mono/diheme cytochrome c family protein